MEDEGLWQLHACWWSHCLHASERPGSISNGSERLVLFADRRSSSRCFESTTCHMSWISCCQENTVVSLWTDEDSFGLVRIRRHLKPFFVVASILSCSWQSSLFKCYFIRAVFLTVDNVFDILFILVRLSSTDEHRTRTSDSYLRLWSNHRSSFK